MAMGEVGAGNIGSGRTSSIAATEYTVADGTQEVKLNGERA